jgi:hypothetical protein
VFWKKNRKNTSFVPLLFPAGKSLSCSHYRIAKERLEQKDRTFGRKSIDFPRYRLYAE